jgi:hypothetical protein
MIILRTLREDGAWVDLLDCITLGRREISSNSLHHLRRGGGLGAVVGSVRVICPDQLAFAIELVLKRFDGCGCSKSKLPSSNKLSARPINHS